MWTEVLVKVIRILNGPGECGKPIIRPNVLKCCNTAFPQWNRNGKHLHTGFLHLDVNAA